MNAVDRVLDADLVSVLDRLAASLPEGAVATLPASNASLRPRLDEVERRLADLRAAMADEYGQWRRALEDLENLWALACWRSAATQEPVEQAETLAA